MSSAWIFGCLSGILIGKGIGSEDVAMIIIGALNLLATILTSANIFHLGGDS